MCIRDSSWPTETGSNLAFLAALASEDHHKRARDEIDDQEEQESRAQAAILDLALARDESSSDDHDESDSPTLVALRPTSQPSNAAGFPPHAITTVSRYRCGYCGAVKPSTSVGSDGRVRIRCKCGGKHRDGKPRMHAMWNPVEEKGSEHSSKRACTEWSQQVSAAAPRSMKPLGLACC
eukprot:TRINITY_DN5652_c0_g1_i2.p1 TRINITY_DN5652_c0_g1~~TRINITY_DN5652_c0_g1_i2.p1  ORF type:complete len:179 (+),score=21.31 TRINITY_DN5652_c0_g1_i2:164-700(+)